MKRSNLIGKNVEKVDDMNKEERGLYDEKMKYLLSKYSRMKNWRKLLGTAIKYTRPFLGNAEALVLNN